MSETSPSTRREFLQKALVTGALTQALSQARGDSQLPQLPQPQPSRRAPGIVDTNVYIDPWPFRRLPLSEPSALAAKCRKLDVHEAWVGSLDALLHRDLAGVNNRLTDACAKHPEFIPIGCVNPLLPNWEGELQRCSQSHRMRGIRLHPNYHGYKLDDRRFVELLHLAVAEKLIVQIAAIMEDERTQNPLVQVAPVDIAPLAEILEAIPQARVMLLNWTRVTAGKPVAQFLKGTKVVLDIAMLEGIAAIEDLLTEFPAERLVFGSYSPVFYYEAAKLKLQESQLTEAQLRAITSLNAKSLLV